jgi:hypothetical protein
MPPHHGCSPNLNDRCSRSMAVRTRRGTPMAKPRSTYLSRRSSYDSPRIERSTVLTRVVIAAMARGVMRACSPSKPQQQQSMSKPFRMSSREAYRRVMIWMLRTTRPACHRGTSVCESWRASRGCSVFVQPTWARLLELSVTVIVFAVLTKYTSCLAPVASSSERRSFVRMVSSFFCASACVWPGGRDEYICSMWCVYSVCAQHNAPQSYRRRKGRCHCAARVLWKSTARRFVSAR